MKDRADVFPFEDREINYSCRKLIEYTGEELNDVTMYWAVEEFLYPGEYRVDIFADNYMIGTRSFTLKLWVKLFPILSTESIFCVER